MRKLSEIEVLDLQKLLQAETQGLVKSKMMVPAINDKELKGFAETTVLATETRIKGIQQFINENQLIDNLEVQ